MIKLAKPTTNYREEIVELLWCYGLELLITLFKKKQNKKTHCVQHVSTIFLSIQLKS